MSKMFREKSWNEKTELESLKNDINEIKEMLRNLSNGN